MSLFVYIYVIFVILSGLAGLSKAVYDSIKIRKISKGTSPPINTADMRQ